jgi:hypothetical protein
MSAHFLNLYFKCADLSALLISRDLDLNQYLINFEEPDRSYAAFLG